MESYWTVRVRLLPVEMVMVPVMLTSFTNVTVMYTELPGPLGCNVPPAGLRVTSVWSGQLAVQVMGLCLPA